MYKSIKNILTGAGKPEPGRPYSKSYSQYGEDQIIWALLHILKLENINFIDIGANDPYILNNTALLNDNGIYGINIEPDPENFAKLKAARDKDINLNIGISDVNSRLKYYRFTDSVYNTFSESEYNNLLKKPELKSLPELDIEVKTYNDIVKDHLNGIAPAILFVDTEGLDEQIIDSIDFDKYAPKILCIETFSFGLYKKDHALINKIIKKGFDIHADTFINTIFINNSLAPYPYQ
jgi:FkbM family methyltransferase